MSTMSVTEAKREFLRLVRAAERSEETVIEKNGRPVAALIPYPEYARLSRLRQYLAMRGLAEALRDCGVTAREALAESRRELEEKGS